MNNLQKMEQEKSVLRWGGLAGMLGFIFFILTFVVVIVGPVGMEEPTALAEWDTRFPDVKAARVAENIIYLAALILEVPLFLALYRALRKRASRPLSLAAPWAFWASSRWRSLQHRTSLTPRSLTSITLLGRLLQIRRQSPSCGRRSGACSMRCST